MKKKEEIEKIYRNYCGLKEENINKQKEILKINVEIEKINRYCSDLEEENRNQRLEINEMKKCQEIICLNGSKLKNSTRNSSNYIINALFTLKRNLKCLCF